MRATHTSNDVITEIITTLQQLKEMHQLNLELLEQLDVTCGWILDNHIVVPNRERLVSLLAKAKSLLNEAQAETPKILQYGKLSDGFLQRKKSDKDLTEPDAISVANVNNDRMSMEWNPEITLYP